MSDRQGAPTADGGDTVPAANVLEVRGLTVDFEIKRHEPLRAVDKVDLVIEPGETVGLVGESGSGKTTIGRAILGLVPVTEGSVRYAGREITGLSHRERRKLGTELQVVFQDPYSSLNPTMRVGVTLAESLRALDSWDRSETDEAVRQMLGLVGLSPEAADRYPSQFSGGQRQRIAIARALMVRPRLVICDEPVSALDLSVQAQVLNLLRELQQELGVSYLFIAHDLTVVRHLCQRTVVLYRGRVMEQGDAKRVHDRPVHPYTRALIAASPVPDPEQQRRSRSARSGRSVAAPLVFSGQGCPFASRCQHAETVCQTERPSLEVTPTGSEVACHMWREIPFANPAAADE